MRKALAELHNKSIVGTPGSLEGPAHILKHTTCGAPIYERSKITSGERFQTHGALHRGLPGIGARSYALGPDQQCIGRLSYLGEAMYPIGTEDGSFRTHLPVTRSYQDLLENARTSPGSIP